MEIEFQSEIDDFSILIPEQFRSYLTKFVKVTIVPLVPLNESKIQYAPRGGAGMLTQEDISYPKIDTTGWKFNREEAHE